MHIDFFTCKKEMMIFEAHFRYVACSTEEEILTKMKMNAQFKDAHNKDKKIFIDTAPLTFLMEHFCDN